MLLTDTHLKRDNGNLVKSIVRQCIDLAIEIGVQKIIHVGDWFDISSGKMVAGKFIHGQPESCLHDTIEMFGWFAEHNISFYIVPGNHEKSNRDSENSYLDIFSNYPNINVLRSHSDMVDLGDSTHAYSLPYFTNSYVDRLKSISPNGSRNILLTHKGVDGARNNDGSKVESDAQECLFDKFDLVLCGDYHNKHSVNSKIHYIGSAYQANFGEDEEKGFTILYDDLSFDQIISDFPKFIKYEIDLINLNSNDIQQLIKEKESGDNIKIEITGDSEKLKSFDKTELESFGIQTVLKSPESIISKSEDNSIIYDKESIIDSFVMFCKENEFELDEYVLEKMEMI